MAQTSFTEMCGLGCIDDLRESASSLTRTSVSNVLCSVMD